MRSFFLLLKLQQNGRVEILNDVLISTATAFLEDSKFSKRLWEDGVSTASYLYNRTPHKEIQNVDSFKIDENDPSNINIENYINKIQLIDNRKIKHINIEHNFTKYTNKINKSSNYSKNKKINNFNNHKNYIQDILNNSNPEQNCNLSLNINNKRILNSNINHVNTNIKKVK
eukprot:jgi/Orpsp1_1/1177589/evm.model.c7180000062043.1